MQVGALVAVDVVDVPVVDPVTEDIVLLELPELVEEVDAVLVVLPEEFPVAEDVVVLLVLPVEEPDEVVAAPLDVLPNEVVLEDDPVVPDDVVEMVVVLDVEAGTELEVSVDDAWVEVVELDVSVEDELVKLDVVDEDVDMTMVDKPPLMHNNKTTSDFERERVDSIMMC